MRRRNILERSSTEGQELLPDLRSSSSCVALGGLANAGGEAVCEQLIDHTSHTRHVCGLFVLLRAPASEAEHLST